MTFYTKMIGLPKKMCDTNKNVIKMGVILKRVYCIITFSHTFAQTLTQTLITYIVRSKEKDSYFSILKMSICECFHLRWENQRGWSPPNNKNKIILEARFQPQFNFHILCKLFLLIVVSLYFNSYYFWIFTFS